MAGSVLIPFSFYAEVIIGTTTASQLARGVQPQAFMAGISIPTSFGSSGIGNQAAYALAGYRVDAIPEAVQTNTDFAAAGMAVQFVGLAGWQIAASNAIIGQGQAALPTFASSGRLHSEPSAPGTTVESYQDPWTDEMWFPTPIPIPDISTFKMNLYGGYIAFAPATNTLFLFCWATMFIILSGPNVEGSANPSLAGQ
jgi:hypothetical protein